MNYETAVFLDMYKDEVLSDSILRDVAQRIEDGIDPKDFPGGEDEIMYALSYAADILNPHLDRFINRLARIADREIQQMENPFLREVLGRTNPYEAVYTPDVMDILIDSIRFQVYEDGHITGLYIDGNETRVYPVAILVAAA